MGGRAGAVARARWIPFAAGTALVSLIAGLSLPVVTFERAVVGDRRYSVIEGIVDLAAEGHLFLAILVGGFSVAFPLVKLAAVAAIWFGRMGSGRSERTVRRLALLGKWSMLDVFVIAILIGAVRLGVLAEVRAEPGIYLFGLGILLSMVTSFGLRARLPRRVAPAEERAPASAADRWVPLATAVFFVAGATTPLIEVEKWGLWDSEYSALDASWEMARGDHPVLAALVLVFVVLLPLARAVLVAVVRWRPAVSERLWRRTLVVDEWAMLDVYGLALLVVIVKVGDLAGVQPRTGLWLLLVAAVLGAYDSWRLRAPRTD